MATTINPYLNFNGQCEAAFELYKSVFGGEFTYVGRYSEVPPMEGQPALPESDLNKILHISLPISNECILMGADTNAAFGGSATAGNNVQISINTDSKEEAERIFAGLSKDGQVSMPMSDTFWGAYFGMLVDPYGINWMINVDQQQN